MRFGISRRAYSADSPSSTKPAGSSVKSSIIMDFQLDGIAEGSNESYGAGHTDDISPNRGSVLLDDNGGERFLWVRDKGDDGNGCSVGQ